MRISDWSSDVGSSDLIACGHRTSSTDHSRCRPRACPEGPFRRGTDPLQRGQEFAARMDCRDKPTAVRLEKIGCRSGPAGLVRVFAIGFLEAASALWPGEREGRSEEHTSEPVTNAHLVCRLLLEKKKKTK